MCTDVEKWNARAQLNTEIERLETELRYLNDNDVDTDSHLYKETERQLHEAYQLIDNV